MNTAVVTGASRGIGRAIAKRSASEGWKVVAVRPSAEAFESRSADSIGPGGEVESFPCDVTDEESVAAMAAFTNVRDGSPDLPVNDAVIPSRAVPTRQLSRCDWDEVLAANLTGPLLCAKAGTTGDD